MSQMAGINTLFMFMINIFEASGTKIDPYTASMIVAAFRAVLSLTSSVALRYLCNTNIPIEFSNTYRTASLSLLYFCKCEKLFSTSLKQLN